MHSTAPPTTNQLQREQKLMKNAHRARGITTKQNRAAGLGGATTTRPICHCFSMRVLRAKQTRKTLRFFKIVHGIQEPYEVLCDGTFMGTSHCCSRSPVRLFVDTQPLRSRVVRGVSVACSCARTRASSPHPPSPLHPRSNCNATENGPRRGCAQDAANHGMQIDHPASRAGRTGASRACVLRCCHVREAVLRELCSRQERRRRFGVPVHPGHNW